MSQTIAQTANKAKRLRQDRFQVNGEPFIAKIAGWDIPFEVIDYSASGISLLVYPEHLNLEKFGTPEFELYFDDILIQKLNAQLVRQEQVRQEAVKLSFRFTSGVLSIESVEAGLQAQELLTKLEHYESDVSKIPELFVHLTLELRDSLARLREQLKQIDVRMKSKTEFTSLVGAQTVLARLLAKNLKPKMDNHVERLGEVLKGKDEAIVKAAFEFFRQELSTLIYESPFSDRSLNKPLGYAGDFELMNMLYRSEPLGNDLFAKFIHYYIIDMPGGHAVRNRAHYLHEKINRVLDKSKNEAMFLSVASGPAYEVQMILTQHRNKDLSNVKFCLLDQDQLSLKFAQRKILELTLQMDNPPEIEFINADIKSLFRRGLDGKTFNLIYSAGLFDYFSDPVAQVAGRILFDSVKNDGSLIIGNFDVSSQSRLFMEMAWDWNLVYRSEEDLKRLFGSFGGITSIEKEASGVNLFANIHKGNNDK